MTEPDTGPVAAAPPEVSRSRVLLVEDADADVFLVREALVRGGIQFELQVLSDGEAAVDFIDRLDEGDSQFVPQIILLDLNLPKKSGGQVLERIRRSPRFGSIPVVVLTSSDSPRDKGLAAQLRATEYFRKPSKLDEYMQLGPLVRDLLQSERLQPRDGSG